MRAAFTRQVTLLAAVELWGRGFSTEADESDSSENLSAKVSEEALRAQFAKHGQLGSVLLTPSNTLGLVEFLEVGEAKKAFRSLAYTKLEGAPLYLEWAPVGVLDGSAVAGTLAASAPGSTGGTAAAAAATARNGLPAANGARGGGDGGEDEENDGGESCTLFVKNLAFRSTSDDLRKLFEKRWTLRSASIVMKRDPKDDGKVVSMGYGFVEFANAADARAALREMSGARLHDHVLQLKPSARSAGRTSSRKAAAASATTAAGGSASASSYNGKPSEKLVVRNLPFQANQKEVRQLFATFGQLKTVRLPKKFDGTHRGFAFVEFASKGEAKKALEALRGTHLYGRHLVLQYAEEEKSVDALREKLRGQMDAAVRADEDASAGARKKKRKKGGEEDGGAADDPLGSLRL